MTLAELQKFIADSKGEWEQIEFKKTTGELHGGMETLCGFLNGSGGKVLFGVTNAGKIQGQDVATPPFRKSPTPSASWNRPPGSSRPAFRSAARGKC